MKPPQERIKYKNVNYLLHISIQCVHLKRDIKKILEWYKKNCIIKTFYHKSSFALVKYLTKIV